MLVIKYFMQEIEINPIKKAGSRLLVIYVYLWATKNVNDI